MDDDCPGSGNNIHFILVNVDTMNENGFLAGRAHLMQAVDDGGVVFFE